MKAVMISIKPKWVEKIANNEKTIEVRKTAPKLEVPFKCYIYATKNKRDTIEHISSYRFLSGVSFEIGKVIGEFICDRIDEYHYGKFGYEISEESFNATMLTAEEFCCYGKQKPLYGLHISNLKIYNKPKEISEFKVWCDRAYELDNMVGDGMLIRGDWRKDKCMNCDRSMPLPSRTHDGKGISFEINCNRTLTRPPQSWCYVEI